MYVFIIITNVKFIGHDIICYSNSNLTFITLDLH